MHARSKNTERSKKYSKASFGGLCIGPDRYVGLILSVDMFCTDVEKLDQQIKIGDGVLHNLDPF